MAIDFASCMIARIWDLSEQLIPLIPRTWQLKDVSVEEWRSAYQVVHVIHIGYRNWKYYSKPPIDTQVEFILKRQDTWESTDDRWVRALHCSRRWSCFWKVDSLVRVKLERTIEAMILFRQKNRKRTISSPARLGLRRPRFQGSSCPLWRLPGCLTGCCRYHMSGLQVTWRSSLFLSSHPTILSQHSISFIIGQYSLHTFLAYIFSLTRPFVTNCRNCKPFLPQPPSILPSYYWAQDIALTTSPNHDFWSQSHTNPTIASVSYSYSSANKFQRRRKWHCCERPASCPGFSLYLRGRMDVVVEAQVTEHHE